MSALLTGGCLCGGTRYELSAAPRRVEDCHCVDCRRSAGAPYMTWGDVRKSDLQLTGHETRKIPWAGRLRHFAACCGTHLFFEESSEAEMIEVAIATLDDPTPFPSTGSVWTEDRMPGVLIKEPRE